MHHNNLYQCDQCGDEKEFPSDMDIDIGICSNCHKGQYHKVGESYDQEWVDEQKYNQQQDREYEDRHRHDRY